MNGLLSLVPSIVTQLMNIELLGTTLRELFSMNLIEGFFYLCENLSIGSFLLIVICLRLIRRLSRALTQLIRESKIYKNKIFKRLERENFSRGYKQTTLQPYSRRRVTPVHSSTTEVPITFG